MSVAAKLSPSAVDAIFRECLFRDGEDTSEHVRADGITFSAGFHPARLADNAESIAEMLNELPEMFREGEGGGWSFLQACEDRHGSMWTGDHGVMDQLFMLGVAAGKAKCLLPREMWSALPGGMPYYVITGAQP